MLTFCLDSVCMFIEAEGTGTTTYVAASGCLDRGRMQMTQELKIQPKSDIVGSRLMQEITQVLIARSAFQLSCTSYIPLITFFASTLIEHYTPILVV
jgi:hypothetical protein